MPRRDFVRMTAAGGFVGGLAQPHATDAAAAETRQGILHRYAQAADPTTTWADIRQGTFAGTRWRTLLVTSQRWRDTDWLHELSLVLPATAPAEPTPMILWIDGGSGDQLPRATDAAGPSPVVLALAAVAAAAQLPAAVIRQVPFQPMFGGMVEDDLIAHSFVEYARTGDPTWPLLLPMVKAAVVAMNAAEQVAGEAWGRQTEGFVVTGASKRGWTTWLTSAVDARVKGLVPIVIDMLSLRKHLDLQRATFGGRLSGKLHDYTSRGIDDLIATPRGEELLEIVDPYAYRTVIPQPKVIALGTNDPYWPLGAVDLYYDDLAGPRWLSYTANGGHGLPAEHIGSLVAALGRHVAGREPLPEVAWTFAGERAACHLRTSQKPQRLVLWQSEADSRDFRTATWRPQEIPVANDITSGDQTIQLSPVGTRHAAAFVECRFPRHSGTVALSTTTLVREP